MRGKAKVQQASDIDQESTGDARVCRGRETAPAPRPATCAPLPPRSLATGAQLPRLGLPSARDVGCPLRSATVPCVRSGEQVSSIEYVLRAFCMADAMPLLPSCGFCRAFSQYASYDVHLLFQSFVDEDPQASVRNQCFMGTSHRGEDSLTGPLA